MNIPAPFAAVDLYFNAKTEMALELDRTSGYAVVTYGPNFPGVGTAPHLTSTGLANDGTAYTATVLVDGTHSESVSVVGSAAQTFASLITEINADLGGFAVAALVGSAIVITSNLTGTVSAVTITDTGTYPLFGSVHGSTFYLTTNKVSVKGNIGYANWSLLGPVTQANVSSAIDSFLAATTANSNQPWTSGVDTLTIPGADTHVIATLSTLVGGTLYAGTGVYPGVVLTGGTGVGATANITVAGGSVTVCTLVGGGTGYTVGDVLTTANTNIGGSGSGFTITVATTVHAALSGSADSGLVLAIAYDIGVNIDGAGAVNVVLNLTAYEAPNLPITYNHVAQSLNTALFNAGVAATATFTSASPGVFTVTSNSVGTTSTVALTAGTFHNLIAALGATAQAAVPGVNGLTNVSFPETKTYTGGNQSAQPSTTFAFTNWNDVMLKWPCPTGLGALFTSGTSANVYKESKPAAKGDAVRTAVYTADGGTTWKYFDNDATVGASVVPPDAY